MQTTARNEEKAERDVKVNRQLLQSAIAHSPVQAGFPRSDLISIRDLSPVNVAAIFDLASLIKARPSDFRGALAGKQVVMFFEKPSLRTRLTFESGMASMGGSTMFVDQTSERLGSREKLSDVAHNVERWVDGLILRTFGHGTIEEMAEHACIPVINALSDLEHPCQALADYFTLYERFDDLHDLCLAYVGDGNNVANSLILTAASLGSRIRVATPPGYEPDAQVVADARVLASQTGAKIELMNEPCEAVIGVDAIYTDAWTSMGHEHEAAERDRIFVSYQVNDELIAGAAPHAVFMHCLPAHRGMEITDSVIDSVRSVVFDQAESRLHVQKAIMLLMLGTQTDRVNGRIPHA